jgi:DNA-directed RNA polymerase II subunit RPB2
MDIKDTWNIIDSYFKDEHILVRHHLDSYNDFLDRGIISIFRENNPLRGFSRYIEGKQMYPNIYFGGIKGDKIYYGKPTLVNDEKKTKLLYPNEARIKNKTYSISIHYDVDVIIVDDSGVESAPITLDQIYLGQFPVMIQSKYCNMYKFPKDIRYNLGECVNDRGGYFIIDGKEKLIVSQEKFADNILKIREYSDNDDYKCSADIRSVSTDASKDPRTISVRITHRGNIVVSIPNVRAPIPLFIVMRALGVLSDKDIIKTCMSDLEKYAHLIELFRPSVHDSGDVLNQLDALKFIGTYIKGGSTGKGGTSEVSLKITAKVKYILMDYLFAHIGELNFQAKAMYLGYIVKKLLYVYTKKKEPTDRDSFKYKRVELSGSLMYDLFREYYNIQLNKVRVNIDKKMTVKERFRDFFEGYKATLFEDRIVEEGVKKGFKGNWGAKAYTKRMGIVQDVNRLSYNSFMSHLRKLNLPMDSSAKVVKPRYLHSTQWGVIDPFDTPDGGNVGFHKHLAISTHITTGYNHELLYPLIKDDILVLEEVSHEQFDVYTKLLINGNLLGIIKNIEMFYEKLILFRRNSIIPIYTSIQWNKLDNELYIYTDSGRLCRPIFHINDNIISYEKELPKIKSGQILWKGLTCGTETNIPFTDIDNNKVYIPSKLYGKKWKDNGFLKGNASVIEYLDAQETESSLIAMYPSEIRENISTHLEIHPSLALGIMGNQIVFPEHNQLPRDVYSCGQSRQGISLYHTNFQNRIDKTGIVLNYGQQPLVKSRYTKYINNNLQPYGENVIVAIMCYGGYNVEDSILFNRASIERGMFNTTYYNSYETIETSSKVETSETNGVIMDIKNNNVTGKKPGYDYTHLDKNGIVKEGTQLNDKIIVIGKGNSGIDEPDVIVDDSVKCKKGQLGVVDKSFISEGEKGFRIAKVRIREHRTPVIGDKFCSRCGQKGTVGLIIDEEDMPFTEEGLRPDIIINPHAIPSRMTIGQLVESVLNKVGCIYGTFGDCTAFINDGPKHEIYGNILLRNGFHSSGNEMLYNGMTGEMLESSIFIGPTYYMRLKHMVKDKINYRAKGPRAMLTRQTVQGRANDGGLRIGEMERDSIAAHGMTGFLRESMITRGDKFYMAICNKSGTLAIYNKERDIFLSPYLDGPLKYNLAENNEYSIETVSKFGRSFSIICVPYCFKLLYQELQTMNVQMKLITEDNIKQYLEFSDSFVGKDKINNVTKRLLDKLGKKEADLDDVIVTPIIEDSTIFFGDNELSKDQYYNLEYPYYYLQYDVEHVKKMFTELVNYKPTTIALNPPNLSNMPIIINKAELGTYPPRSPREDDTPVPYEVVLNMIGDKFDMKKLYVALQGRTTITDLKLFGSQLGVTGVAEVVQALQGNTVLTSLNLGDNQLGDEGAVVVAEALQGITALTTLGLDQNQIGNAGMTALAEALQRNTVLTTLGLSNNEIGDEGVVALAKALQRNTVLTTIYLYNNEISVAGVAMLAAAIKKNKVLTTLGPFSLKGIDGDKAVKALNKVLDANYRRANKQRTKSSRVIKPVFVQNVENIEKYWGRGDNFTPYQKPNHLIYKQVYNDIFKMNDVTDFFSQHCRVRCLFNLRADLTPLEYFEKNKKKIYEDIIKNDGQITLFNIKEYLFRKINQCTNFNITMVMNILNFFKPKRMLDCSAGWGDRLIGAIAYGTLQTAFEYLGYDPSVCMHENNNYTNIIETLAEPTKSGNYKVIQSGFEDAKLKDNYYDLVFTSPPFFALEIYEKDNEDQSTNKFDKIEKWKLGFLYPLIKKSCVALELGGHIALYIDDYKDAPYIEDMQLYVLEALGGLNYLGVINYMNVKDNNDASVITELNKRNMTVRKTYVWKKVSNSEPIEMEKYRYKTVNTPVKMYGHTDIKSPELNEFSEVRPDFDVNKQHIKIEELKDKFRPEIEKIVNSEQNLERMGTGKKKDKQYFDNLFRWANEDQLKNVKDRKYFDWVIYSTFGVEGVNIYGNSESDIVDAMMEAESKATGISIMTEEEMDQFRPVPPPQPPPPIDGDFPTQLKEVLGMVQIKEVGYTKKERERKFSNKLFLSIQLHPNAVRKGVGTTAIYIAINELKKMRPDIKEIYADVHKTNKGSQKLMNKFNGAWLGSDELPHANEDGTFNIGKKDGYMRYKFDLDNITEIYDLFPGEFVKPQPPPTPVNTTPYNPKSPSYNPESYNPESPYNPKSPSYNPASYNPDTPPYNPKSPSYNPESYNPESPYNPKSPSYNPASYNPESPYNPKSPSYNPKSPPLSPESDYDEEGYFIMKGDDIPKTPP